MTAAKPGTGWWSSIEENSVPRRKRNETRMKKAWLIQWDAVSSSREPEIENEIAGIFSPRLTLESIKKVVARLYADKAFSLHERIKFAKGSFNPYPALTYGAVPQISCGDSLMLYARPVENLVCETDQSTGQDVLSWDEPIYPNPIPRTGPISITFERREYRHRG